MAQNTDAYLKGQWSHHVGFTKILWNYSYPAENCFPREYSTLSYWNVQKLWNAIH